MDWAWLLQLLQLLRNNLPAEPIPLELPTAPVPDEELRALLESIERNHREETDAAVRAFSRSGKLPELSGNERYFLARRVDFAAWLLLALSVQDENGNSIVPAPPQNWQQEDQVEWMLIWAWRTPGCRVWLEKTIASELLARQKS